MTNPTLSWTVDGPRAFTMAGANPTVAEALAGLKAQIDAHSAKWMVSDYSAGNGTLELKRNPAVGTVTGELASVRILIMGGQTPHANCLAGSHTAGGTTSLYGCLSVDAATTGPGTSYASGAPYSTKFTRAGSICVVGTLVAAQTPKITIFEADDVFGFSIGDNTNYATFVAGRIVERASDTALVWGVLPSGGLCSYTLSGPNMGNSAAAPLTTLSINTGLMKACYWDTVTATARLFGRLIMPSNTTATEPVFGAAGGSATMLPVPVGESSQATGQTGNFLGYLRQLRFGPYAQNALQLRDAGVLKGTHICGQGQSAIGIWLDEVA